MNSDGLVPVPMRVRHVAAGDVFVSRRDGSHWRITEAGDVLWRIDGREVTVEQDGRVVVSELDPDHVLDVLVPAAECDAVELLHAELGAQLIAGRKT